MGAIGGDPMSVNEWIIPLALTVLIVGVLPLAIGFLVLVERKVLADMQVRHGPMRVGPHGVLQFIADAVKLTLKEDTTPALADKPLYWLAPVLAFLFAISAFAVIPLTGILRVVDINVGVLFVTGLGTLGVLAIILAGWASNSHYPLLGALRSAAQLISYEVPLSIALLCPVLIAGTLNLSDIVVAQEQRGMWLLFSHGGLMLVPAMIFLICATAESNRSPFDLPEAESELVSGYHTEYSGFRFALFMLSEYTHMLVISALFVILFLGGWLVPFASVPYVGPFFGVFFPALLGVVAAIGVLREVPKEQFRYRRNGLRAVAFLLILAAALISFPLSNPLLGPLFWFGLKLFVLLYLQIWFRGTFPRLRFDQLMDLSWKRLTPLALGALVLNLLVETLIRA